MLLPGGRPETDARRTQIGLQAGGRSALAGCSHHQAGYRLVLLETRERFMRKSPTRFLMLGVVTMALVTAPVIRSAFAAGDDNPSPPASDSKKAPKKTKKNDKSSSLNDPRFVAGYHTAYTTIYDKHDYATAIDQLQALGHDENAAVANLIGYSYRKLGDYKVSQIWYERALKADPNHVKTWQYYGLWQLEQGNREQAEYHLNKIAQLAGTGSDEYRSLAAALEKPPGTGLVY